MKSALDFLAMQSWSAGVLQDLLKNSHGPHKKEHKGEKGFKSNLRLILSNKCNEF